MTSVFCKAKKKVTTDSINSPIIAAHSSDWPRNISHTAPWWQQNTKTCKCAFATVKNISGKNMFKANLKLKNYL